jgi:hypothetical protein
VLGNFLDGTQWLKAHGARQKANDFILSDFLPSAFRRVPFCFFPDPAFIQAP